MSSTLPLVEGPADAELISAVRGGDVAAYGDLFERHVGAARRLARQLVSPSDADDLVSAAFAKVLAVLQRGGGPDVAFRAYLLTSVRRLHVDQIRAGKRVQTTDDITAFDPGEPFRDTAVEGFESGAAARAFASLPERWQLVLWHTEVEGHKPADIAPMLGMTANSVAALAYRAREGLRQAFLTMHAGDLDEDGCRFTHQNLGPYVRGGTSRRDSNAVREHLGECRKCMAIYLELTEVNSNLAGILGPIVLGGAAAAYVAAGDVAVKAGGLVFGLGRVRDFVTSQASGAAIAGVAATAVLGGSAAFLLFRPDTTALMTADPDRPGIVAPSEAGIAAAPSADVGDSGGSGGSGGSGPDGGGDGVPGDPGTDATDPGDPGAVPPTASPTDSPTSEPTTDPTGSPTDDPTGDPTGRPTDDPTDDPTDNPTTGPTDPTTGPTDPTTGPTDPTTGPTDPTTGPTDPTTGPTDPTTDPPDGRDASVDAVASGSGDDYTVSLSLRQLLPTESSVLVIEGDNLDRLDTLEERCDVGPDGGVCTFSRGAAENLVFSASPVDGEAASVRFTIMPSWIDPDPTNNVDDVLIGADAADPVPASQSWALGLVAANLTLLAAQATRSRIRSSRPGRHARRSS